MKQNKHFLFHLRHIYFEIKSQLHNNTFTKQLVIFRFYGVESNSKQFVF